MRIEPVEECTGKVPTDIVTTVDLFTQHVGNGMAWVAYLEHTDH